MVVISVSQGRAALVMDMRSNSEADKTRIVVELDAPAQYQAHYTSEPGISICLLESGLKSVKKTISVDDELVKTVAMKEVMGSIVEVSISLRRGAAFTIFPLESPDRIVVDVMPDAAMGLAQPLSISTIGSEAEAGNSSGTMKHEDAQTPGPPLSSRTAAFPGLMSELPLQNTDYVLAQLCFNVLLVVALMVMGIKLWRVTRISKKNLKTLKEGMGFADMISRLQAGVREKDDGL